MNRAPVNMGRVDRLISILAGAGALSHGLRKPTVPRILIAGAGAGFLVRGLSGRCPLYRAAGIDTSRGPSHPSEIRTAVTILKSPEEVFALLEDQERLRRCMKYFEILEASSGSRLRWKLTGPGPVRFSGETELTRVERPSRVEWKPAPGSKFPFTGELEIQPAPHLIRSASVVKLRMKPDSSLLGRVAMGAYRVLDQVTFESLSRMKQLLEAGEVATIEGQPTGRRGLGTRLPPVLPAGLKREESGRPDEGKEREIV